MHHSENRLSCCPLVAPVVPRVGEYLALYRREPPGATLRMEGELQNAVRVVAVDFAVRQGGLGFIVALAANINHGLADAVL